MKLTSIYIPSLQKINSPFNSQNTEDTAHAVFTGMKLLQHLEADNKLHTSGGYASVVKLYKRIH